MTANTKLIHAIADALIGEYDEEATEWLEDGGRANIERIVAEWRAAIAEGRWVERLEDVLVLRALRHEEHWVTVRGGPDTEVLIRELVDEDWRARGVETATRIGDVFAHELLRGDTGEPFESIEYDWREHGSAVRGEDDEQPWNAATPLSGTETRLAVCLAEARYVERRVPFVDLAGKVRHAKAAVDAGDKSGWTPVTDGPVFRYVRALREDGVERTIPPDLRLRTLYTVELVCAPGRSALGALNHQRCTDSFQPLRTIRSHCRAAPGSRLVTSAASMAHRRRERIIPVFQAVASIDVFYVRTNFLLPMNTPILCLGTSRRALTWPNRNFRVTSSGGL